MDEHRQYAYRMLLYYAMLDIRQIGWQRPTWIPWQTQQQRQHVAQAGALADALHNLAHYAASDFEGFLESHFWEEIASLERRFPESAKRYRALFDDALERQA